MPTELTFESFYISSKRIKPRDAGERARDGASPPCPFIKGAKGTAVPFMKISWVVVYQDRIEKIHCSYSRTQKLRTGFLYFLVILLRSTSLLNRNKHNWQRFLFINLYCPQFFIVFLCSTAVPSSLIKLT